MWTDEAPTAAEWALSEQARRDAEADLRKLERATRPRRWVGHSVEISVFLWGIWCILSFCRFFGIIGDGPYRPYWFAW